VQAVGAMPVDFAASGASALTLTGHKIGGPYGVGALLLARDTACVPLLHGGGQERDVRSGTLDVPAIHAFATAVRVSVERQPEESKSLAELRDELVAAVLREVPDAVLNAAQAERLPGNAHFTFPGCAGDSLLMLLDAKGIECSTGSACTAGVAQPSHVLLAMGADPVAARGSLRFSLGHTSTHDDVEALAREIGGVVARARQAGLAGMRKPKQKV
jgi:cysteine desulfurase